jgi:cytochrome c peroxidase
MSKKILALIPVLLLLLAFRVATNSFHLPKHFPKPVYEFNQKSLDSNRVLLGRALFYDPILSRDSSQSCSSCHSPYNAFAHTDHQLSHGINDRIGKRNAPALMNLAWQKNFMWDGAVNHLDVQALAPISNELEMDEKLPNIVAKLRRSKFYPALFRRAFNSDEITGEHLLLALSQFQLTLISATSKYDSVMLKQSVFNEQQQRGYALFKRSCNACHTEPLFSNYSFRNNGLPVDTGLLDMGRMTITQNPNDSLLFKVPTLRNLEFTYPYMHDGRFKRLGDVLNHYTSGIQKSETLSSELNQKIELNSDEKIDLIAFLLTLSDRNFIFNKEFAYPRSFFQFPN